MGTVTFCRLGLVTVLEAGRQKYNRDVIVTERDVTMNRCRHFVQDRTGYVYLVKVGRDKYNRDVTVTERDVTLTGFIKCAEG